MDPAATSLPAAPLRRPLLGLAFTFAIGVGAGLTWACPATGTWLALALVLIGACLRLKPAHALPLLHVSVLLAAWVATDLEIRNPSPAQLSRLLGYEREYAMALVMVDGDPIRVEVGDHDALWAVPMRIEGLRRTKEWKTAKGSVEAMWREAGTAPPARYGDRLFVGGSFVNGQEADRRGRVRLYVDPTSVRQVSAGQGHPLMAWCLRGRDRCAAMLTLGIEDYEREAGFLRAMMLGLREDMPDAIYRAFAETGTLHIVAISGTHVGVAALILVALFRAMGFSRRSWILLLAPLLMVYTLATGMAPSAVRSCIMALVFFSSPIFLRRADGPSALALAALVLLAAQPSQLADPGFILSFGIVGGLMVLYPAIARPLERLWLPDPWRLQAEAAPVRLARWVGRGVTALFAASVAAWLVSTPLTAVLFNNISLVSLLANLLVIPLSSCMLLTGFLSLVVGWMAPFGAEVFNHANRLFTWLLLRSVAIFNSLPGGNFYVLSPAWGWLVAWYGLTLALFLGTAKWRRIAAVACVVGMVAGIGLYLTDRDVRVAVLGTGRTALALCDVPGAGDVLVNAGDAGVARRTVKWLRAQGVDRLGALVLAAPTADVASGASLLLEHMPVEEIWVGTRQARSRVFQRVLQDAAGRGVVLRTLSRGDRGELSGDVEWEVLHPVRTEDGVRAADGALVLRFARGPSSVIVRAPAAPAQEVAMTGCPVEQTAQAVVCSGDGPGDAWLAVAGKPAVIRPGAFEEAVVRLEE